jgi:hypothetical protein
MGITGIIVMLGLALTLSVLDNKKDTENAQQ